MKELNNNGFYGNEGDRICVNAELKKIYHFCNKGLKSIHIFKFYDENENLFIRFSPDIGYVYNSEEDLQIKDPRLHVFNIGEKYVLEGTIVKQKDFGGEKENILNDDCIPIQLSLLESLKNEKSEYVFFGFEPILPTSNYNK